MRERVRSGQVGQDVFAGEESACLVEAEIVGWNHSVGRAEMCVVEWLTGVTDGLVQGAQCCVERLFVSCFRRSLGLDV
jgi:hypothetical protein